MPDGDIFALLYRLHATSLLRSINSVLYCLLHTLAMIIMSITSCFKTFAHLWLTLHNMTRVLGTDPPLLLGTGGCWQGRSSSHWGLREAWLCCVHSCMVWYLCGSVTYGLIHISTHNTRLMCIRSTVSPIRIWLRRRKGNKYKSKNISSLKNTYCCFIVVTLLDQRSLA